MAIMLSLDEKKDEKEKMRHRCVLKIALFVLLFCLMGNLYLQMHYCWVFAEITFADKI
jgi:hypothetical protein